MTSPSRSGVFSKATDRRVDAFTESISFDHRLYSHDIRASIAHARMLTEQGFYSADEFEQVEAALQEIGARIERAISSHDPLPGGDEFPMGIELEDIHMHIERALIDRLGDAGAKLHTGRSRNDQVATDFRLWVRDAIDGIDAQLVTLQRAFAERCDTDAGVVLPAYTHLQRAQPVLAAHYYLAYCEKLQRDRERLADCRRRVNRCTLGCAALAGTTIAIDRDMVARELEFDGVVRNSIDASSDRDFVLETAFVLTLIAEHLSTWAEEWILWATTEFNFIRLPGEFCTGSSIMPQKINPDVLELTRGKTARVIGNLQTLLTLVKGLPLAYNRDLQEDKPALFDTVDTVSACLQLAAPIVSGSELNRTSIAARLDRGHLDATTLMEYLIKRGKPQRHAHHLVGSLVGLAMDRGVRLADLELSDYQELDETITEEVFECLGVEKAIAAFTSYGSTAPREVERQVTHWRERLANEPTSNADEATP
ncbi:MAG: argininosuccinate lyase [Pirellulaceae bacterium]|nr:argininosuccinate lyase [Pirellulaceae bacterium]